MRLRTRLALVLATTTSLLLASAFGITFVYFKHGQERQFDVALLARARLEVEETQRAGGRFLHIEQEPTGSGSELERLVKYGAVYREDGSLLDATPTFAGHPPELAALKIDSRVEPGVRRVEFPFRGEVLRGVVIRFNHPDHPRALLLLAAPRGELDADTRQLLEVMLGAAVASTLFTLLLGWFLGVRMSRGIESLALVTRRVSKGELSARAEPRASSDDEVRQLGADLNQMIERTSELLTAERRFASNAAHELRSPLSALRGELELALRRPRDNDQYKAAISESLESTERLVVLSEDLLALARAGSGSTRSDPETVPVADMVADAVRASLARAEHSRNVTVDVPSDLKLSGRRNDLTRMLRNLIDNAVQHAPEGTEVIVSCRPARGGEHGSELVVQDSGPGVPDDLRSRIFEPFVRGALEREHSGAGLGLAIAREIALAHGGDLYLEDSHPPTRFVVRLPALRAATP